MNYRDLESVRQIVAAATNLDISYAYEDLVFPENTAFIIQFDDNNLNNLFCYFHEDCDTESRKTLLINLEKECLRKKCNLEMKGNFILEQKNDKVQIQFL